MTDGSERVRMPAQGTTDLKVVTASRSRLPWRLGVPARHVMVTGGYGLSSPRGRRGALRPVCPAVPAGWTSAHATRATKLRAAAAANRRTIARSSPAPTGPGCGRSAPARASDLAWSRPGPASGRHPGPRTACRQLRWPPTGARYGRSGLFPPGFPGRPGQPGQASRRASQLHQAGDALAVGLLRDPRQHPVPG